MVMAEPTSPRAPQPEPARSGSPTPPQTSETLLVRGARQGDLESYDELVRLYQERIYATIYHMTSNHKDANDLAQEAFIKANQALKSVKGGSSFYTWVYRIAVKKTINFLKQRKTRGQMSLDDLDFNAEHDPDLVALISE